MSGICSSAIDAIVKIFEKNPEGRKELIKKLSQQNDSTTEDIIKEKKVTTVEEKKPTKEKRKVTTVEEKKPTKEERKEEKTSDVETLIATASEIEKKFHRVIVREIFPQINRGITSAMKLLDNAKTPFDAPNVINFSIKTGKCPRNSSYKDWVNRAVKIILDKKVYKISSIKYNDEEIKYGCIWSLIYDE